MTTQDFYTSGYINYVIDQFDQDLSKKSEQVLRKCIFSIDFAWTNSYVCLFVITVLRNCLFQKLKELKVSSMLVPRMTITAYHWLNLNCLGSWKIITFFFSRTFLRYYPEYIIFWKGELIVSKLHEIINSNRTEHKCQNPLLFYQYILSFLWCALFYCLSLQNIISVFDFYCFDFLVDVTFIFLY